MKSALLFTLLALATRAPAQDDVVFRSGVSLVRVDAEVVDSSGNIVTGLTRDNFSILDQGAEQSIVNFSFEKEPLDLILLFDTGNGIRSKFHEVLRAVELGFHELQKGDRVCVMAFGSTSIELAPFTADLDAVNTAIALKVQGLKLGGNSNIAGAASDAAARFHRESVTARRRAVLVVSDKTSRGAGDRDAIRDLWQSDAVLGELVLGKRASSNPIADETGGATLSAFQESIRRLRRRYTLYYALPKGAAPGAERKIEIRLRSSAATVRARAGYIVKSSN